MSSRKKAIARIVADEVARETRRQERRYAADMEPVYIALYENKLAEQRLAQLLAGMAPATTLPRPIAAGIAAASPAASTISRSSASAGSTSATPTPVSIYTPHVPEVKGTPCTITFSDNTDVVKIKASYNNIIDAILALWNERARGEAKWPVFVKKDTTTPITEWAMLCEASKVMQVSVNLMDEVQLPAVYAQAKLRYGSNDLITIHLPAWEANVSSRTVEPVFNEDSTAYITDGRNGNSDLLVKDLETRERPKLINGKFMFPKLSSSKDRYTAITNPVPIKTKDLWVFFMEPATPSVTSASASSASSVSTASTSPASKFKSLQLGKFDSVVFDSSVSDLVYQVMKHYFKRNQPGTYTCIVYKPSEQSPTMALDFNLNFENIPQENLVLQNIVYKDMVPSYQKIANQLLFAAYSETTTGPKTIVACKPAIADLVQWIAFLQKTGVNIDAKEAVENLEGQCTSENSKTIQLFSTNLYKLYQSTYEAIYYFVKEDMTKHLTKKNAFALALKTYRNTGSLFRLSFSNRVLESEIIELLKKALGTRCKILKCFPEDSQSIQELFRAYASVISADQKACISKHNELTELKLYFEEISPLLQDEEPEAFLGSSDTSWKQEITNWLDAMIVVLQSNCYEDTEPAARDIRNRLNNYATIIVDADAKNLCPATSDAGSGLALKDKMEQVITCLMGKDLLVKGSIPANYIADRIKILQVTPDDYLRFTTYKHLKDWTQEIKDLQKLVVSGEEKGFLDGETDDGKKKINQKLLQIAKLYLATDPSESRNALEIVTNYITAETKKTTLSISALNFLFELYEKIKSVEQKAQFETQAEIVDALQTMNVENEGVVTAGARAARRASNALLRFLTKSAGPSWR